MTPFTEGLTGLVGSDRLEEFNLKEVVMPRHVRGI